MNDLQVDEFFKFMICSIKKLKKLDPFVSNVKAHGIPGLNPFFFFFGFRSARAFRSLYQVDFFKFLTLI